MDKLVCIVIPNYNGAEHLDVCIQSLQKQTYKYIKIIVVDNNSSDNSVEILQKNYPEVEVVQVNYNSGFSKAVNIGIEQSMSKYSADYVLLLNNDIECEGNFVEELLKGFIETTIGSVSPKMLNFYKRNIIDGAGNFIDFKNFPYQRGANKGDNALYNKSGYIFGASAGAALYKAEVFKTVGLFDEDFFAYFEDVDFSFRLQYQGYKCYYNPKAVCYHKGGATSNKNRTFRIYLCERNLFYLMVKDYPFKSLLKNVPFFLINTLKRYVFFLKHYPNKEILIWLKAIPHAFLKLPYFYMKRRKIMKARKVEIAKIILKETQCLFQ